VSDKQEPPRSRDDEAEAARRRRAAVFGEVLPEGTKDDRDPGEGDGRDSNDEWLRSNVPPHHG